MKKFLQVILKIFNVLFAVKDDLAAIHKDIDKVFKKAQELERKENLKISVAEDAAIRAQEQANVALDDLNSTRSVAKPQIAKAQKVATAMETTKASLG